MCNVNDKYKLLQYPTAFFKEIFVRIPPRIVPNLPYPSHIIKVKKSGI